MKKCKLLSLLLILVLLFSLLPLQVTADEAAVPPDIEAKAGMLIELNSNTILYEKEADTRIYPASLTKIMTCLVALENSTLTDTVTVTEAAFDGLGEFSSTAGLFAGEMLSMENLLYCMMISSANEACNIAAISIAGSVDAYVEMMNQRAQELGCKDTHFANTHGLHNENHYTTARDLSIITREALKNNTVRSIVSTYTYTVPPTNLAGSRTLTTTNSLMNPGAPRYYDKRVNGVKTGFTTPAGRCLIATAQEGTISLLSIVCGCETRILSTGDLEFVSFPETKKLLEFGFSNYTYETVLTTLYPLAEIKVLNSAGADYVSLSPKEEITVLLPAGFKTEEIQITTSLIDPNGVSAPIAAGQELGTVNLLYHDQLIGTTPLVAINSVEKAATILPQIQPTPQAPAVPGTEGSAPQTPGTVRTPTGMEKWLLVAVAVVVTLCALMLILIIAHKSRVRRMRRERQQQRTR